MEATNLDVKVSHRNRSLVRDETRIRSFHELPFCDRCLILTDQGEQIALRGNDWYNRNGESARIEMLRCMNYWYGIVPVESLKCLTLHDTDHPCFSTFDRYHHWYVSKCSGHTPRCTPPNLTALVLSAVEGHTLQDGTHRFHHYVDQGKTRIPVIAAVL